MRLDIHSGHVLGAAAVVAPALGLFAPLALAPVAVLTAAAATALVRTRDGRWPVPRHAAAAVIALGVLYAFVSVAWGIEKPGVALFGAARLALMLLSGLVLVEIANGLGATERAVLRRALAAGFALGLVLVTVEVAFGAPIRRSEKRRKPRILGVKPTLRDETHRCSWARALSAPALRPYPKSSQPTSPSSSACAS